MSREGLSWRQRDGRKVTERRQMGGNREDESVGSEGRSAGCVPNARQHNGADEVALISITGAGRKSHLAVLVLLIGLRHAPCTRNTCPLCQQHGRAMTRRAPSWSP